jgi:threonine-phosphate decarboxylase
MSKNKHGGDIHNFAKAIGCNSSEVIDLSSNINFVKPKLDIDFNTLNISSYPNYHSLKSNIATLYKVKNNKIELFNGATSGIYALFKILGLKEVNLYAPLYSEYKKAAKAYGYNINLISRFKNINQDIKAKSLVVFVNPSTPDGTFYKLDKLMQMWMAKECTILVDESFLDFSSNDSSVKYLKQYKHLYILKSMTKFYSSAGIRIGAIISSKNNIKQLQSKEPMWKLSQFDSCYLNSALRDNSFSKRSKVKNEKSKDYLINILKNYSNVEQIFPSSANFVMVKLKNINAISFQQQLIPYKIMIRNCSNFDFLDNSYVRIAVKNMKALKQLKEALCKISI